jgi:opacity protein-like surface antigen
MLGVTAAALAGRRERGEMNRHWMTAAFAAAAISIATPVAAQWNGFYLGGFGGLMLQNGDHDETVTFDTDLDEEFGDTVRTITGADAFSPGFCPGAADGPTPASECDDDESGFVLGGRAGYDAYAGSVILGVVGDLTFPEANDSVSAFSTQPAFYTFTRDLQWMAGLRGRIGAGNDHVLAYATGGVALGRIEHVFATSNLVNTFVPTGSDDEDDDEEDEDEEEDDGDDSSFAWGYQVGGGVELWISNNVAVSAEYLFTTLYDRDDGIVRAQGPAPPGNLFLRDNPRGTDLRRSDNFVVHAITVGVVYRF